MKQTLAICVLMLLLTVSCKNREQQKRLEKKEADLNAKEQQLLLREKTLEFREQELDLKIRSYDSLHVKDSSSYNIAEDSAFVDRGLIGNWLVKMTCTETSCAGSAVGDVKTEQWNLSYEGSHLVAKASDRGNLVRTYSGLYKEGNIELIEHRDSSSMTYDTRMVVRLRVHDENLIEGQREIIRENDCKIIYALQLSKIQP